MPQHFNGLLGGSCQLCLYVNISIVRRNIFILNVNIFPGQSKNLSHTQRTRKSKIHGDIQLTVRTLIQRQTNCFRIPDVPLFVLGLWKDRIIKRVFPDQFPSYRLLESTAEQLDNLFNGLVGNKFRPGFPVLPGNRRRLLKGLNVLVHHTGRNVLNLHVSDNRIDIVGNQGCLAVIHRHAPFFLSVGGNKVIQKIRYLLIVRRKKCAVVLLVLNFCFPFQGFFMGMPGFPFLFRFSIFINIVINNGIRFFTFDNRCHSRFSFLS